MRAGPLRDRVQIMRKVVTRNTIGDEVPTWELVREVWASVEPLRGREYISLREAQSDLTTRIRMRYTPDIGTAMRVVSGDSTYDIDSIVDVKNRHRELELLCVAEEVPT